MIVIDEELSTVHFAHSSVRRYLLSEPTDLEVQDYHVDPAQADINLGKLAVTYLSLDVLCNQLVRTDEPSRLLAAELPSFVVRSALPKAEVVNKVALAILRGRKKPSNDSTLDVERNSNLVHETNTHRQEVFSFLPYCQEFWLCHSNALHELEGGRVYELWERLVEGETNTVDLPWAPENFSDFGKRFEIWIGKSRHTTLIRKAIRQLWNRYDIWQPKSHYDMPQLENFLSLLFDEKARHSLKLGPVSPVNDILCEAARCGYETIIGLALHEGANINASNSMDYTPLYAAVLGDNMITTQLLIQKGADVNRQEGGYGSALQVAAVRGKDQIVELLIASGADVNAHSIKYGTALMAAVTSCNSVIVRRLLEAGADPNANGGTYGTALLAGIAKKDSDTVHLLIEKGANVNGPGLDGETPLRMAAKLRKRDMVENLLMKGAIIDFYGFSQKYYMKEYDTSRSIAQLLYENKDVRKFTVS